MVYFFYLNLNVDSNAYLKKKDREPMFLQKKYLNYFLFIFYLPYKYPNTFL